MTMSAGAGQRVAWVLKLPPTVVVDLVHGARQGITVTLVATNSNGTARAADVISRLRR
jgi:hypothetical protein